MWYEEDLGIKLKSRHLFVFSRLGIRNLSVYNNNTVRSTKMESRGPGKSAFYTGYVLADIVHYNCIVFIFDEVMKFLRQDSVFAVYCNNDNKKVLSNLTVIHESVNISEKNLNCYYLNYNLYIHQTNCILFYWHYHYMPEIYKTMISQHFR